MWAIFRKEISSFFASPVAYLIMVVFLILNGLFLWVFKGPFNILDFGFADLSNFFLLAPWVFLLLVPAISMKSFSEEIKLGTLELLYIKPTGIWQIVIGKYLAIVSLCLVAIIPTLIYIYCISALGTSPSNLDLGLALGSYLGLIFLIGTYAGISIFASSITDNQIVAFIAGLVLCFLAFYLWEAVAPELSSGSSAEFVRRLGLKARFDNMARGIIDTRDLIYFLSLSGFFLLLTVNSIKYRKR